MEPSAPTPASIPADAAPISASAAVTSSAVSVAATLPLSDTAAPAVADAPGSVAGDGGVEGLAVAMATTAHVVDASLAKEQAANVRRTHAEALDDGPAAQVTVQAPGYEAMLDSKHWEELPLHPDLIKGIYAKGWERPSKIQARALPYILGQARPNLLAQAKNGAGKTGAFGLAMIARADPS